MRRGGGEPGYRRGARRWLRLGVVLGLLLAVCWVGVGLVFRRQVVIAEERLVEEIGKFVGAYVSALLALGVVNWREEGREKQVAAAERGMVRDHLAEYAPSLNAFCEFVDFEVLEGPQSRPGDRVRIENERVALASEVVEAVSGGIDLLENEVGSVAVHNADLVVQGSVTAARTLAYARYRRPEDLRRAIGSLASLVRVLDLEVSER